MSNDSMKQIIRRWVLEMWGGGNLSLVDQLASPNYVYGAPGLKAVSGGSALKDLVTLFRTAFPGLNNTVEDQVAEGMKVVTRGTTRGTHQGLFQGVPATGVSISVPWVMISRFEGEKIAEEWEIFDAQGLMQQVGGLPSKAENKPAAPELPV